MTRHSLFFGAALTALIASGAVAQTRTDGSGFDDMSQPRYSNASGEDATSASNGDNLGNHRAESDLDMRGRAIINLDSPVDPRDAATMEYVDDHRDHLGNHTAEEHLKMEGFEIIDLGTPTMPDSAATRRYVDNHRDHLGNHIAEMDLNMAGFLIRRLAAPVANDDAATKEYVDNHRDHLGNHNAEQRLNMNDHVIMSLADLVPDDDGEYPADSGKFAVNKNFVDGINTSLEKRIDENVTKIDRTNVRIGNVENTRINAGTGLSGGGRLNSDVTLSFSTSWGDNRYALRGRSVSAGDGLRGGGNMASDRTLHVDDTVVRTHGTQSVNGAKTFSDFRVFATSDTPPGNFRVGRNGGQHIELHGGGIGNVISSVSTGNNKKDLHVDVHGGNSHVRYTFGRDGTFQPNRVYTAWSGNQNAPALTFGGDTDTGIYRESESRLAFSSNGSKTLHIDRGGAHLFGRFYAEGGLDSRGSLNMNNNAIYGLDDPSNWNHAANKRYVDNRMNYARNNPNTSYNRVNAGWGLIGGGRMNSDTSLSLAEDQRGRRAGDSSKGVIRYNGTGRYSGTFYGGGNAPSASQRLNYDGFLYATRFYAKMYLYFSDRNLKSDIETLSPESGLDGIRAIRPVSYTWKENGDEALGVIAQEVEEIFPSAVKTNEQGIKAVDYIQLVAPVIGAIQELDDENVAQRREIAKLEERIADLEEVEARLASIEAVIAAGALPSAPEIREAGLR